MASKGKGGEKRKVSVSNGSIGHGKKAKVSQNCEEKLKELLQAPIFQDCMYMKPAPEFIEYIYKEKNFKNDFSTLSKTTISKYCICESETFADEAKPMDED